jgi:SAM-dependent methyltransferase
VIKKLTFHNINGDKKINLIKKIIYLFYFFLEIFLEKKINGNLYANNKLLKEFLNFLKIKNYKRLINVKSPVRILSDYYLYIFLKSNFNKNKKITILDVGCGKGQYSVYFKNYFKNLTYFGFDIKISPEWQSLKNKKINFFVYNIGENRNNKIKKIIKKVDLIFSVSVFEHIKNDLKSYIQLIKNYPAAKHLHIVPGSYSFLNYLQHGFRRYNIYTIKKLQNYLIEFKKNIRTTKIGGNLALYEYFDYYKLYTKKKHILSFIKIKRKILKAKELVLNLINDNKKSYSVFYALEF